MQQQLNNISKWYHDTGSLINLDKAQTLTTGEPMPAVTFDGTVAERTIHLRYLNIMLTYRKHVETTTLRCKKGLSVLMASAAKNQATSSYCIKMWCSVSLTTELASQQWHKQIC